MRKIVLIILSYFIATNVFAATVIKNHHLMVEDVFFSSATYIPTDNSYGQFKYESAAYDPAPTIYFEACLDSDTIDTAYAMLYDTGGSAVSGSELSNNTSAWWMFRSSAITLVDGTTYTGRYKGLGQSIGGCRLVFEQTGTISKTLTEWELSDQMSTISDTSYAVPDGTPVAYYDSTKFDGTVDIYFEACIKAGASGTTYVELYNLTDTATISGSEVSTSQTSPTLVRTAGTITLTTAKEYVIRVKRDTSNGTIYNARIIFKQTNNPTKWQEQPMLGKYSTTTNTSYSYPAEGLLPLTIDPAEFSGGSRTFYHEAYLKANSGYTSYAQTRYITTQWDERSTTSTSWDRQRSGALTPNAASRFYSPRIKTSASGGTVSYADSRIVIDYHIQETILYNTTLYNATIY